jgi:hypothetical protein
VEYEEDEGTSNWEAFPQCPVPEHPDEWFEQYCNAQTTNTSTAKGSFMNQALNILPPISFTASSTHSPSLAYKSDSLNIPCRPSDMHGIHQEACLLQSQSPNSDGSNKQLILESPNTTHVRACIRIISVSPLQKDEHFTTLPVTGPPPFIKLLIPPSQEDTIRLFTLSTEQAFTFLLLSEHITQRIKNSQVEPLRMILTGEPGVGKSQAVKALEWWAYQHECSHAILVVSYTWRAALHVASQEHPPMSSSTAFGINARQNNAVSTSPTTIKRVQHLLQPPLALVIFDEYTFISCSHWHAINKSSNTALANHASNFGGLSIVLSGDPRQHNPPNGCPLYKKNPKSDADLQGHNSYISFQEVCFLKQQQRTPCHILRLMTTTFMNRKGPSIDDVTRFCELLNSRVMTNFQVIAPQIPRVVCLRNELRNPINLRLAPPHHHSSLRLV